MRKIQILMYHQVGNFPAMTTHRATYCDYRRFARQMAYLKIMKYRVLTMGEVVQCVQGKRDIPHKAVALTFDDAYENFYEYAFPVLEKYSFPATVYAISNFLGKPASWLALDNHLTPPLMSGERLRHIQKRGMEIGSHSATHIRLAEQSPERVQEELIHSKKTLEDVLGTPVKHFCYPYGSHDIRIVKAVAAAGYVSATTCERASATSEDDLLALPRKAVSWGDSLIGVLWKMHMKHLPKHPLIRRTLE